MRRQFSGNGEYGAKIESREKISRQLTFGVMCSVVVVWLFALLNPVLINPAFAADNGVDNGEPQVTAKGAILLDEATGQVLWEKNGYKALPPASTTKILTALLCLDMCMDMCGDESGLEREVEVSPAAAAVGESSAGLISGERFRLGELLDAALLKSANDACFAIAEGVAGSEPYFVHLLNVKAASLGAVGAKIYNTNGLPDERHEMSCYDLALLARSAMQHDAFRERVGSVYGTMEGGSYNRALKNTNKLLLQNEYVTGIKTGTTNAAGACLVSSMERDGRSVIAVVLNSGDRYGDSIKLLNYGIDGFCEYRLISAGQYLGSYAGAEQVPVRAGNDLTVVLPKNNTDADTDADTDTEELSWRYFWREGDGRTKISVGDVLGTLELVDKDGERLGSVALVAARESKADSFSDLFWGKFSGFFSGFIEDVFNIGKNVGENFGVEFV